MRTIVQIVLNVIWLMTAGVPLFITYMVAGVIGCIFIVTIPAGIASFRIALYALWPFGREVVASRSASGFSAIGNVIWFVVAGWWLALGHIGTAILQTLTVVGIPLAWANLKLIPVTCFPFGKEIVDSSDSRARLVPMAGE